MTGTGKHRLRDDPYPDELDQQFCEEDETLCMPGRPCWCCWVEQQEAEAVRKCNACPAPATCSEFGHCTLETADAYPRQPK